MISYGEINFSDGGVCLWYERNDCMSIVLGALPELGNDCAVVLHGNLVGCTTLTVE